MADDSLVYFRRHYAIRWNLVGPENTIDIELMNGITLTFLRPVKNRDDRSRINAIGTSFSKPDDHVLAAFSDLANRKLPPGSIEPSESPRHFNSDGSLKDMGTMHLDWLPEWFRTYYTQTHIDLDRQVQRAIRLIRWRMNIEGGHSTGGSGFLPEWSIDGQKWNVLFPETRSFVTRGRLFPDVSEVAEVVDSMANASTEEPLGHELFREAWDQRRTNPRSALIIGIAAGEAGMKEFIMALEPGTSWLVEHSPSPPLILMLAKYLPQLINEHRLRPSQTPTPRNPILRDIEAGIKLRNKLIHGVKSHIDHRTLEATLLAIRDSLWMLDVLQGHDWARRNIRPEVLGKWDNQE